MVLTVLVSGCYMLDSNLPRPQAIYGRVAENTIAVNVNKGFRNPGIHHVQRGTTLRELLKTVPMLGNPGKGSEGGMWSVKLGQLTNGKPTGFISNFELTDKELDTVLEDGAEISVVKYNL